MGPGVLGKVECHSEPEGHKVIEEWMALPLKQVVARSSERRKGNMKNYRMSKNTTAHYSSLEELREAMHLPKIQKRTKNNEKLAKQREHFLGRCRVCGEPLSYISGTNVLVCSNDKCQGHKITARNENGEDKFVPVMRVLDDKGAEIANSLFD